MDANSHGGWGSTFAGCFNNTIEMKALQADRCLLIGGSYV